MTPFLIVHIAAGGIALLAGALALAARKGSPLHRRGGRVFAAAMLVMALMGGLLASGPHTALNGAAMQAAPLSVQAAFLTIYLVVTAVLTVRNGTDAIQAKRQTDWGCVLGSAAVTGLGIWVGLDELAGEHNLGVAGNAFFFAVVSGLALFGDLRLLRGKLLTRSQRLARHLWRMCFAMFIATGSFFLGQAKFFPEAVRKSGLLAIPVLLVLALGVYWLLKLLLARGSRGEQDLRPPASP